MGYYYLDTSALVKYYLREPGSAWVRELVNILGPDGFTRANSIVLSDATIVESASAFAVLQRTQRITRRRRDNALGTFRKDIVDRLWGMISVITDDFQEAADLIQTHPLKAFDAVQLAVALRYRISLDTVGETFIFVSGDRTLLTAAQAEGLVTDNPFNHVSPQDSPTS